MDLKSQPGPRWAFGAFLGLVVLLAWTRGFANDDLAETLLAKAIRAQEQQSFTEAEAELDAASQAANDPGLKALIERQRGLVALAKVEPTTALKFFLAAHALDATIRLDPARHAQDAVDLFSCARVLHQAGTKPTGAVTRGVDGHWACPAPDPVPIDRPEPTSLRATPSPPPNTIVQEPTRGEEMRIPLLTWVGGGAAIAFAGTGIALGAAAMGQATDANADSDGKGLALGANIAFAVAGSAAITAIVAWMIE